MARVDFPDSPSNGATVIANGITYIYNAAKGVWRDNATAGIASDNPPANPVEGQMWFNSTEAALYFYYNDGSSAQWVSVSGPAGTDGSDGTFSGTVSQSIIPDTDSAYDLGSATNKFRSLYLSSDTLYLGDSASISAGTGGEIILPSLKIGTGDNAVKLEADASGKLKTKKVVGGVTQAAEEPGNATVVTDMAGLIAVTGMSAGQTALVTTLNKVFMYTGSAWYLIATMTNSSPTDITGVNATYGLATDGTATTITAVSTDPEGFALTWSYAVTTGSLGSTATVSQADNVFTITPSTTEADAGSFSITFSATDGATGAVNAVSEFTLGFDPLLNSAAYSNTSLSVSSQDSAPLGLTFKPDGSRLFIAGNGSNSVLQYDLSTNYDLSTAQYNSVSFSVSSQDDIPRDVVFSADGTKMFVAGFRNNSLFQYSLSSAFAVNTASYDNVSLDLSSQQTNGVTGCTISADGTKFYTIDSGDTVYQYNLTTAYDLSSATYSSASYSINSQDNYPLDVVISSSGQKMYIAGDGNNKIFQYTLSTPNLISSASYDSVSVDHSSQGTSPSGVAFSSDGTKMFVSDYNNQTIFEYDL